MTRQKALILVAEDDHAYGKAYVNKLAAEGYEVVWVSNGGEVMPALRERRPDLLMLDLIMPDRTGLSILEELRADPNLKDLKVIVASNLSNDIDKSQVAKFEVQDYFVKSDVSIGEMMTRLRSVLRA